VSVSQAIIVLCTAGREAEARSIAHQLVDERLAACVNIVGPIRSVYRWREAVEDEPEFLLIIKTRARLFGRMERRLLELHSYQVPEVLALAPSSGSAPYLRWLLEATAPKPTRPGARAARRRSAAGKVE
jgi:periplasmic divalent cation tolerance protein